VQKKAGLYVVIAIIAAPLAVTFVWTRWKSPAMPDAGVRAAPEFPGGPVDLMGEVSAGVTESRPAGRTQPELHAPSQSAAPPRPIHPLLGASEEAVLGEGGVNTGPMAGPELASVMEAVVRSIRGDGELATLTIDYPLDGSIFPPDIVPPTFLWHEPAEQADTWLIDVAFGNDSEHIYVLSPGYPPPKGKIDPTCIAPNNEVYKPTPYQAAAKSWTPSSDVWAAIKQRSTGVEASVTIFGFPAKETRRPLSRGRISFMTSNDPVGAPIFYRDVPLAPSRNEKGQIKPLGERGLALIGWRLRDISKPQSRLLLTNMPTCANCHSFSANGKTFGMDLDGPQGDKGTYVITSLAKQTVIEDKDVITWNSFQGKPDGHKTIGFMSQLSPDGQFAVTTLNEALYVRNFLDYKFLQVFYPTRGILAYYSRTTGEMKALPGADDPNFVHCDPAWGPNGKHLVFARAEARDPYPGGSTDAVRPNDPAETQIQYDLYRISFDGGRGGKAEPIAGASNNGMSNTFPKVSPDGKWIIFVKCRNGQLLRPDGKLWIVPAAGGTARLMRCNTSRMNSWHSFSPDGRWMVFSSKANTPYTQMFLTHIDEDGNDSPPILIPNATAANRAVNIPEFVNVSYDEFVNIEVPSLQYLRDNDRGIELASNGKLKEALAVFGKVLASHPDYWQTHVNAGLALFEHGMLDQAIDRFNQALQLDPNAVDAHCNLGAALLQKGMPDKAMTHIEKALELQPRHLEAHGNLAMILLEKSMLQEATAHFRIVVELDPENPPARLDLANVLLNRGMFEAAVEHVQEALEIDPRFIEARLLLGNTLAAQGEFESAIAQFEKAREIDANNLDAINELAWLLAVCPRYGIRDGARAVQLIERPCMASGYRDPRLLSTLAAAHAEMGVFPEAVAIATRALAFVKPEHGVVAERLRLQLEHYRAGKPYRSQR